MACNSYSNILVFLGFAIARHFVHPRYGDRLLPLDVLETLCLETSREFYDNASSGNYNFGDMKLAYEW